MIRNILIIGRTGTGKSTLGNVLINKNGNFEEMFRENSESVSEINIKQATFEVPISTDDDSEKIRYRIIDTVGIENSRLTPYGVLSKLAEVAEQIKAEGLNHIFLVTEGKFTKEEIKVYDLLSSVIFNRDALKYTTVVRTRFPKFKESEKCQRDRETLRRENPDLAHILNNVNIIYVNNPSLQGEQIEINKKTREASRDNLINHLVCYPGVYWPNNTTLFQIFNYYKTSEEKFEKEKKKWEIERKQLEAEIHQVIGNMKKEQKEMMQKNDKRIEDLIHKQQLELREITHQAEEREKLMKEEIEIKIHQSKVKEESIEQEVARIKQIPLIREELKKLEDCRTM